jgi:tryptophan synthase alpha subunit
MIRNQDFASDPLADGHHNTESSLQALHNGINYTSAVWPIKTSNPVSIPLIIIGIF